MDKDTDVHRPKSPQTKIKTKKKRKDNPRWHAPSSTRTTYPSNFHPSRNVSCSNQPFAHEGTFENNGDVFPCVAVTALYEHMTPLARPSMTHDLNAGK